MRVGDEADRVERGLQQAQARIGRLPHCEGKPRSIRHVSDGPALIQHLLDQDDGGALIAGLHRLVSRRWHFTQRYDAGSGSARLQSRAFKGG